MRALDSLLFVFIVYIFVDLMKTDWKYSGKKNLNCAYPENVQIFF